MNTFTCELTKRKIGETYSTYEIGREVTDGKYNYKIIDKSQVIDLVQKCVCWNYVCEIISINKS